VAAIAATHPVNARAATADPEIAGYVLFKKIPSASDDRCPQNERTARRRPVVALR